MLDKEQMLQILKKDVVPALGCTEPGCVALCAANAAVLIGQEIESVTVETGTGIYKNGMSAGIPHFDRVGLPYAAALGTLLRNPDKQLQLLEDVTPEIAAKAKELADGGAVTVSPCPEESSLYVKCTLKSAQDTSSCTIRGGHTNVVRLEKNGEILLDAQAQQSGAGASPAGLLTSMTIAQIRALVDTASEEELSFLMDGVEMNLALASYSEEHETGVGIGSTLRSRMADGLLASGLMERIVERAASAAESRLDGCPLPTMSSSGSGTKGIVVIIPVNEAADALGSPRIKRLRALALAHLVNRYANEQIGKLSPMCNCVIAAAIGASVGIAYLLDGTDEQLGGAVRNMTGTVTGLICDGGKVGCSLKVATGLCAAVICAVTAVNGAVLRVSDGICAETPEDCIRNISYIGNKGLMKADEAILDIMTAK
ncbi:MAG: L-serine ammonia-lyase, iron-sulfur-dependent, subunit alpha [Clostridia bacterium]|nr:L-serine ammonia-lyase, iron-sulfur-dependent, subunit alpha [Clostridia bacterium]